MPTDLLANMLAAFWTGIQPVLPAIFITLSFMIVMTAPLPGRGPGASRRDPWRTFKYAARSTVMSRADYRCEGPVFFAWGRCPDTAVEADHVYPHSKGGPTVPSNGQALCRSHNRRKSSATPPWWYVLGLERRRASYFPPGVSPRVIARMSSDDRMLRERSSSRRG